jgi:hypothetical protein
LQRCVEGFGHHRTARFFSRFIQLCSFSAQHTGQGQQCFGTRRRRTWNARGQIQRQAQGLIEGRLPANCLRENKKMQRQKECQQ